MLEHTPFHQIRRLMQAHTAMWHKHLPDMTKPQFSLLIAIEENNGVEQSLLKEPAVVTKATLTDLIRRLETRQLVYRVKDDIDRRKSYVYLTQEGKQALEEAKPIARHIDQFFLDKLSNKEQEQLNDLLGRLL